MFSKVIRGEWFVFFSCHMLRPVLAVPCGGATDQLIAFLYAGQMMHACGIPSSCPRPQMSSKLLSQPCLFPSILTALSLTLAKPNHGVIHRIRLQPHAPAFVRVELISVTGAPVASSGTFTDTRSGTATAQVPLRAGHYIIEPTVDGIPGARGTFSLTVYSSCAGISLAPLR